MLKNFFIAILFLLFFVRTGFAVTLTFTWSYSQEEADKVIGFNLYHTTQSLVSEDGNVDFIQGNDVRTYSLEGENDGWVFYFIKAVDESSNESSASNECVVKFCEGDFCNSEFTVDIDSAGTAFASWDEVQSVSGYRLFYKKDNGEWIQIDTQDNFAEIANLESGSYIFRLYAKDAMGRLLNAKYENGALVPIKNTFADFEIDFETNDVPAPPVFRVDSKGLVSDQILLIAFDYNNHPDPYIEYFRVNVYSSMSARSQDTTNSNGDILTNVEVPYGTNFCELVPFSKTQPIFFVSVVAVDYDGRESDPAYGYRLIGDNINRDVDSSASIVDGSDYQMFINAYNAYSQNPYEQRSTDFCSESSLYDLLPFSNVEGCDYNKDGLVNGTDYMMFRNYLYGNSGANF